MSTDAKWQEPRRGRWTRQQVAERLGCSVSSVRRMEGTVLHPEQDERGVWLFDAAEVERLDIARLPQVKSAPSGAEGTIAARVFALFEQGQELSEIVIATRTPPRVVRELYAEYLVDLGTGEQRRHEAAEAREQEREERKWKSWERSLRSPSR